MWVMMLTLTLRAPWVTSLKEKRAEAKSLIKKLHNKFNVSVAESGTQDAHQTITISAAAISADTSQADSISEQLLRYVESSTDAELIKVHKELL
ncbi:DUF503 domain-containing protein [Christensenellaceae bacterium OttesenSCG-928-K19]|nr:DUF503 domain-containing protein [Christensenellaceae bacterium OttesenSCG-928-K19]